MRKPDWWVRFEAKVKSSKVYIACWSRPVSNAPLRTGLSYLFAGFSLFTAIIASNAFFSPYLPIDKLNKMEVVILESYTSESRRSKGMDWLKFLTINGDVEKYKIVDATKKDTSYIDKHRGKKAIIWFGYEYRYFNSIYLIWQIDVNGNLIVDYRYDSDTEVKKANKEMNETMMFVVLLGGGIFVLLTFYVIFRLGRLTN